MTDLDMQMEVARIMLHQAMRAIDKGRPLHAAIAIEGVARAIVAIRGALPDVSNMTTSQLADLAMREVPPTSPR